MADYVSILKRTLDGLGSGATPALRERVYGRARDAVRRQLDGMQPPPAEDVKERQLAQLEAAVAEIEASYAAADDAAEAPASDAPPTTPETPPAAPSAAPSASLAAAPIVASPSDGATTPVSAPDETAVPAATPSEPAASEPITPEPVVSEPVVSEPVASTAPADMPPAAPVVDDAGTDAMPPAADEPALPPVEDLPPSVPPGQVYAPQPDYASEQGYASEPLPTELPPLPASPAAPVSEATSDLAPEAPYSSVSAVAPAPSVERNAAEPETLDADGPVGGYLPDEDLPPVAMIGPRGDPVLDPSAAVPLGRAGGASAFDAPKVAATDPTPGDTDDVEAPSASPPAATLASPAIPRGEPLTPTPLTPDPIEPVPAMPGAGVAAGAAVAGGAGSALAFANRGRPDLPGDGSSDPSSNPSADPSVDPSLLAVPPRPATPQPGEPVGMPRAGDPVGDPLVDGGPVPVTDGGVAMPRADGPADPFAAPPPPVAPGFDPNGARTAPAGEPIVVTPTPGEATAPAPSAERTDGAPHAYAPPEGARRGRGGLWASLLAILVIVGGLLLAREPLAEATGVEGFRTAFGLGPVVDDAFDNVRALVAGDGADTVEVAAPVDGPIDGPDTVPVDPPAPTGDTAVADVPLKTPDRLLGTDAPDVSPSDGDVVVQTVPVETVPSDTSPASGTAPDGEDVAGLTPADPTAGNPTTTPAVPEGDARAFLVGEPVAGVSDRVDGAVSWSVGSASPGRDLPPEPAVRGEVALSDGTGVEVTVRRNADETLPASHLIEIVFALPDGTRTISRLPLVGFKDALGVPARPLVAVPAKITDDFFVVGLNSLASAVQSNLALMGSEQFMDIQIIDGNDRRATLTLEKGEEGAAVFGEVLDAWNDAPLPG